MISIDMRNAVKCPSSDNFTVLLIRLMLKADSENLALLAKGFPVAAKMVEIYHTSGWCPYTDEVDTDGCREVDWVKLAEMAQDEVG